MKFTQSFKTTLPHVAMTTAYDVDQDRAINVFIDCSIGIDPDHQYGGWSETYDLQTGADRFCAGGILVTAHDFYGRVPLVGYDGFFTLPAYSSASTQVDCVTATT